MKKQVLKSQWSQLKAEVQDNWVRLGDEEIDQIDGEWDQLVEKLQERYGYSRIEAEAEIEELLIGLAERY